MTEWKLVPVELLDAVIEELRGGAMHGLASMLAAAPEPPTDLRDAEIERLRAARGEWR